MAITTLYRDIEYRSRLEARWAAFFDRIGWEHTYEPFDGDGYIPDFIVHGDRPLLVEIKPASQLLEYQAPIDKMTRGLADHWQHDLLILGLTPLPRLTSEAWPQFPVMGLLGEIGYEGDWWFASACWHTCANCRGDSLFHEYGLYAGRPCGCYAGDHYLRDPSRTWLEQMWADACNRVKWYGKPVVA